MEEIGVCIELTRGAQSVVGKEEVKRVINLALNKEGKGKEMNEKTVNIGKIIREDETSKGSSVQAMDDYVSALLSKRTAPTLVLDLVTA